MKTIRVGTNAIAGYSREALEACLFLALTPLIAGWLGPDQFGLWSLAWAATAMLSLLDAGLAQAVVKYVARARGDDTKATLQRTTATLIWMYLGLGVVAAVLVLVLSPPVSAGLTSDGFSGHDFQGALLWLGLRAALALPSGCLHGILTGFGLLRLSHLMRVAEALIYACGAVLIISGEASLTRLAQASFLSGAVTVPILLTVVLRNVPGVRFGLGLVDPVLGREMLRFGAHFLLIQTALLLYARADAFLIQLHLPVAAVGLYAVAARVTEKAGAFCRQLTSALAPALAYSVAKNRDATRSLFLTQSSQSILIATPVLAGLGLLAPELLDSWMGPEFSDAALALSILAAAVWISVLHAPSATLLGMGGAEAALARIFVGAQILNVALTLLLLPILGLAGAASATLISSALIDVWAVQRRVAAVFDISLRDFYRATLLPVVPGLAALLVAWAMVRAFRVTDSLLDVAITQAVLCLSFYLTHGLQRWTRSRRTHRAESRLLTDASLRSQS